MADKDFVFRLRSYSLVTVNILYYLPDHTNLVQEFIWQTLDLKPKYPRVKEFLYFWDKEIEARIKEIQLGDSNGLTPAKFTSVDQIFKI
jgi:uncharacterized protein Usg